MRSTLLCILSLVVLLAACRKDTKTPTTAEVLSGVLSLDDEPKTEAEIIIKAESQVAADGSQDIDLQGTFYDNNGETNPIETFTVNGIDIPEANDRFYSRTVSPADEDEYRKLTWGNVVPVQVRSGSFGDFEQDVLLPPLVALQSPNATDVTLSKSADLTVLWEPSNDPGSKVAITVTYEAANSNAENPDLPDENILIIEEFSDKGEAVIPAARLAELPVGGIVTLTVTRIPEATVVKSATGNVAYIQPLSIVHSNALTVID
jgi:hypothetical protein